MPIKDGFEFLEFFKTVSLSEKEKIKIIVLTNCLNRADLEKAKEYIEVIEVIDKPLTEQKLKKIVH
jgi:response regulator RpfG family c-di-GMP phosphodiesterase